MAEKATTADAAGHAAVSLAAVLHGLDSEELAWRARQGCQASFTELVYRYAPRLHVFLGRKTYPSHEVEDLVQDTLIKAYQNLDQYDRTWKFSTWIFTIATRLAVSQHRKRQSAGNFLSRRASERPATEAADEHERIGSLWAMAADLPPSQHQALWLKYAEDMSIKDIAGAMGKSQVCVKVLLYRARIGLAKRVAEQSQATEGYRVTQRSGDA